MISLDLKTGIHRARRYKLTESGEPQSLIAPQNTSVPSVHSVVSGVGDRRNTTDLLADAYLELGPRSETRREYIQTVWKKNLRPSLSRIFTLGFSSCEGREKVHHILICLNHAISSLADIWDRGQRKLHAFSDIRSRTSGCLIR
jgi:hypothetical protein